MQTHDAKRVEIIIEAVIERRLTEALIWGRCHGRHRAACAGRIGPLRAMEP